MLVSVCLHTLAAGVRITRARVLASFDWILEFQMHRNSDVCVEHSGIPAPKTNVIAHTAAWL